MSRLIDADETKRAFVGNRYGTKAIEYVIDSQPTVKAIQIEWIRNNWLKRNDYQGTIEFFPQPTFEDVMDWLIEDWEKENEREID